MTLTRTFTQTHRHYISDRNHIELALSRSLGYPLLAECGQVWIPGEEHEVVDLPMCSDCENKSRRAYWSLAESRPHFVYRCYDAEGVLLYVGCTYSWPARVETHKRSTWWWPLVDTTRVLVFRDKLYALDREREAIENEHPRWNVRHRIVTRLPVAEYEARYEQALSVAAPERVLKRLRREARQRAGVELADTA